VRNETAKLLRRFCGADQPKISKTEKAKRAKMASWLAREFARERLQLIRRK